MDQKAKGGMAPFGAKVPRGRKRERGKEEGRDGGGARLAVETNPNLAHPFPFPSDLRETDSTTITAPGREIFSPVSLSVIHSRVKREPTRLGQ